MPDSAERDFHLRWATLLPPLRPPPWVADMIAGLLAGTTDPLLLLGVTPELASIPRRIEAFDWNARMIALAWPGDTPIRTAHCADWKALPLDDAAMGGAMGDGPPTMLQWPHEHHALLSELARIVRPGGRVVLRCFAAPETPEPMEAVVAAALGGGMGFHAFKLRFNMAAAAECAQHTIASAALFKRFEACFPDRAGLAAATGWSLETIAEIDAYRGSGYVHCYPTRSALDAMMADRWPGSARFVETEGYPLAERCPLLVLDRA